MCVRTSSVVVVVEKQEGKLQNLREVEITQKQIRK
jgi:hypothetical protein